MYFIRAFKDAEDKEKAGFGTYYNKVLGMRVEDTSRFVLDYMDLDQYIIDHPDSQMHSLTELVLQDPDEARQTLKQAVLELLAEVDADYHAEVAKTLRADIKGIPIVKEIPTLNVDDVDHPVRMDGVIIEADERISADIVKFCWRCDEGHYTYTNEDRPPNRCRGTYSEMGEFVECHSQYLIEVPKRNEKVDYIELKMQQRLDSRDEKRTSVDIDLVATGRDLTKFVMDKLHLADYTTINGVIRLDHKRIRGKGNRHIANLYLDATDIEIKPESSLIQYDPAYAELVKVTVNPETEDADYEKLLRSICPTYKATPNDPLVETSLLFLAGSDERKNRDGSRIRGEIQMLFLGDKGTAKSLILKWLAQCRDRSFYTSGSKTSAITLVGGMKPSTDPAKPARATVGIIGMADMVIIDELEKRKPEDLDVLAEPMQDSQSLHIGKSLQILHQDLSVAIAAGANPIGGLAKYDINKDIFTNTKLPAWLLDRFDVVFITRDIVSKVHDEAVFSHIINTRKQSKTRQQFEAGKHDFKRLADDFFPVGYMRQWIQYIRETFHPRVEDSQEAIDVIHAFFTEYRRLNIRKPNTKEERENWTKDNEMPAVHWRTLQSLLRLSEARARCCHRNNVTAQDAERAVNIIRASIASSGLNNLSEMQAVEQEINEIESRVNDVAQRELIKKQYRDANYDAKVFTEALVKLSWERCTFCRGDGFKFDGPERHVCEFCEMQGGKRIPFDLSMLKEICAGKRVLPRAFDGMWKRCLTERMIEPVEEMPGMYWNRRDDSTIIKFIDTPKADIQYEDANSLYWKSLQAKNRKKREYIDEIDRNQEL
jgi:replicative DNA helicase Mcm